MATQQGLMQWGDAMGRFHRAKLSGGRRQVCVAAAHKNFHAWRCPPAPFSLSHTAPIAHCCTKTQCTHRAALAISNTAIYERENVFLHTDACALLNPTVLLSCIRAARGSQVKCEIAPRWRSDAHTPVHCFECVLCSEAALGPVCLGKRVPTHKPCRLWGPCVPCTWIRACVCCLYV